MTPASSSSPAASPAPALAATMPGNGGGGGEMGGMGDCGSPHRLVLTARRLHGCCAWGRRVGEPCSATGQELRPEEPPWGVGTAALSTVGWGIYGDLCLLGRCWGSGCAHAAPGRTPANLLPMGARLSQDGPTSVPYWLLWPRDHAEKHHN